MLWQRGNNWRATHQWKAHPVEPSSIQLHPKQMSGIWTSSTWPCPCALTGAHSKTYRDQARRPNDHEFQHVSTSFNHSFQNGSGPFPAPHKVQPLEAKNCSTSWRRRRRMHRAHNILGKLRWKTDQRRLNNAECSNAAHWHKPHAPPCLNPHTSHIHPTQEHRRGHNWAIQPPVLTGIPLRGSSRKAQKEVANIEWDLIQKKVGHSHKPRNTPNV